MKKLYGVAVNDVLNSTVKGTYTRRVYMVWQGMLSRCYSNKVAQRRPNYTLSNVCERWLTFSNFLKDISFIKGYDVWLNNNKQGISLDKDIINGHQQEYNLENCSFVSRAENSKECILRNGNPAKKKSKSVKCIFPNGHFITYPSIRETARQLNAEMANVWRCCNGKNKTVKGCRCEFEVN